MLRLVDEAQDLLSGKSDLKEFGRMLDYTWKLKSSIASAISTRQVDILYDRAMKAGATGGKLLGAGGGGFLLLYVEKDRQKRVRQALEDLLYIPFQFEEDGARVIYYVAENFVLESEVVK